MVRVTDLADPRLADFANLKDAVLRSREFAGEHARFIAEGENVVRHLVASAYPVRSVLASEVALRRCQDLWASLPTGTPIYTGPEAMLTEVVGFQFHRGVLACGERRAGPGAAEIVRTSRVLVVCEDLANPDNVGAVFRNTAALVGPGAGVLLSPRCCDPLYRKAIRVSMGHALRVPFATLAPWPEGLDGLREAGFEVVAMTPGEGAVEIDVLAAGPRRRVAVLVGTEGPGLTAGAMARATARVKIPMAAGVDSLNVGVALGIALHRLARPGITEPEGIPGV